MKIIIHTSKMILLKQIIKQDMLIFKNYTNTVGVYNGDLKKGGNANYDVMSVYDGASVENPKDIYKKSFKVEELPKVWERSE